MNGELFIKMTRGVLYASIGVLAVAVFFVFFSKQDGRNFVKYGANGMHGGKRVAATEMGISAQSFSKSVTGFGDASSETGPVSTEMARPMPADVTPMSDIAPVDEQKKIIRSGNLSIRVEDAEWSADEIDRIATQFGGFTASRSLSSEVPEYSIPMLQRSAYDTSVRSSQAKTNMPRNGTVIIKVPSNKFSEAVAAIRKIASVVLNESSSASDVSAQFADLEARIKNKYAEEEAFTKILNTTTGKVSDVLEVTRELSRVRGEIEQLETEKKYMESQTDMAEISVSLTEDAKVGAVTNTWRPWQTVKDAANRLIEHFRGLVDGVIYFIVSVLPFLVLYLLGLYILYRVGRKVYFKMRG